MHRSHLRHGASNAAVCPAFALAAILVISCLSLTACFGIPKTPSVAAYVNDESIYEDDVTGYIEGFRSKNTEYETDTGWAEYLKANGYTSETIRTYVLNTNFIPKVLIRQECSSRGIQVTDADLDAVIKGEKDYYEKRYGANSWDSVLDSYGYTEETWRENELNRLLEERLRDTVIVDVVPSEAEIQAQANTTAANYSGKSSYYIAFPSRDEAQRARDSLAMTNDTTTLEAFQSLGTATYAGWNSLPANLDALSTDYIQSLNSLSSGNVSAPIQTGSNYLLIFCDATFNADTGGESVALETLPAEIYNQIVSDTNKAKTAKLFDDWLSDLADNSSIVFEPMPDGLPYSVNVTLAE